MKNISSRVSLVNGSRLGVSYLEEALRVDDVLLDGVPRPVPGDEVVLELLEPRIS